jgi:2,3-bisphosphoglycerate-independent phosphoglycerate mutase
MQNLETKRQVILAVMDGVGLNQSTFGNAVALAKTPNLDQLKSKALYRSIYAHGTYVGMPSNSDLGNSEVGHNALGCGRIFDQGAKLVSEAIASGALFQAAAWKQMMAKVGRGTLHLIGLLSDGNVHSHEQHLFALMREAKDAGIRRLRLHVLLDGRDVSECSAEAYVEKLNLVIASLRSADFDVKVASGGGRMLVTMDRYEADWRIVERGWNAHVHGKAEECFDSLEAAIASFRKRGLSDQYFPAFVITEHSKPIGTIEDGDGVIFFNFRGDRAIEISRAFTESEGSFGYFDRGRIPNTFFAGMMEYDGDLHIPATYLVSPPQIEDTLGEYLAMGGVRQFACSETQKYGHVTFFWNGNRSGKFSQSLETYVEIPSDRVEFDQKPEMKAAQITDALIDALATGTCSFARVNYANGDMVGHTGNLRAAIKAVEVVDHEIGRLVSLADSTGRILMVTADHGNCDEMFDAKEKDFPNWSFDQAQQPKPKTAHTTNPVPFYLYDPIGRWQFRANLDHAGLANIANTVLTTLGLAERSLYLEGLVDAKS